MRASEAQYGEHKGRAARKTETLTLKHQNEQADIAERDERVLPGMRQPPSERSTKDDADENLPEKTGADCGLEEPSGEVE